MHQPLAVTFRNMDRSAALEAWIHAWVTKLEHVTPLQRCTVIVEVPHKHRRRNAPFQVHVTLATPDHELSVTRGAREEYEDPYLAVADAFRAARRQLVDFVGQRREVRHAG
jgi:ribosome-associated translation inhibitor RaiA